jgi:ligand-binding SRPBCC domain-containing protein
MPLIHLTTFIEASHERVFDLSRSVDLHKYSMLKYEEKIVDGVMSGLMNPGDTVTWKAKHLFKLRILKVKITAMGKPGYFVDEQVQGDFAMMKHEHYFKAADNGTIMIDQFHYRSPKGFFGKLVDRFYLHRYITRLLEERNAAIKKIAEGSQWKQFLS